MAKQTLANLKVEDLAGKRVLVRVDFNVPQADDGSITDDTRIRAALPTINHLINAGAKTILVTHLGRPKGDTFAERAKDKLRVNPIAERLSQLLQKPVVKCDDCIGEAVAQQLGSLQNGDVALLENVRFHPEEEANDLEFAKQLASLAEVYVNDAFGAAHRAHASTAGVAQFLQPAVAGFLLDLELKYLSGAIDNPQRPLAAIVGGSKVSSKIGVIESLLGKVNKLLIGGGMIFTFFKARGLQVGKSLVEDDKLELAKSLEAMAKERGVELLLPTDVVVADKFAPDANAQVVSIENIPPDWMGLDIGPATVAAFKAALAGCKTVVWNGPMGVFEFDQFAKGTEAIAHALAELTSQGAITIIGGGDSVAAVEKVGVADRMSHISTGGGASLELLEGKVLPGIAALSDA
ncbi:MAG: phosphoglycerate kinase [Pseudanabaenaceae cyanobacterium SKYGB_i_bin29]|nr:phosphoglycerate kinase [Pseudanabaenaceae cyanobacterium SKYG29]MDW8422084.1 phosphoglycerate kinase [Pseudanabaenaceae cyanobacterium SKYGB_i_bin29]